jgi:hypothetical protein
MILDSLTPLAPKGMHKPLQLAEFSMKQNLQQLLTAALRWPANQTGTEILGRSLTCNIASAHAKLQLKRVPCRYWVRHALFAWLELPVYAARCGRVALAAQVRSALPICKD